MWAEMKKLIILFLISVFFTPISLANCDEFYKKHKALACICAQRGHADEIMFYIEKVGEIAGKEINDIAFLRDFTCLDDKKTWIFKEMLNGGNFTEFRRILYRLKKRFGETFVANLLNRSLKAENGGVQTILDYFTGKFHSSRFEDVQEDLDRTKRFMVAYGALSITEIIQRK